MIRKTVAITIFAASVLTAGCSSSDDDSGLPSNDDTAGIETSETADTDAADGLTEGTTGTTEEGEVPPVETPIDAMPVPDDAGETVDGATDLDDVGVGPVVPVVPVAPDDQGDEALEDPTSGPGADDVATTDGEPLPPSEEGSAEDADAIDTESTEGDTEMGDTNTDGTVEEGTVPPPPEGSGTVEAQPLTAALAELDGNPEASRALITRQLLEGTEFGAMLDGSDEPFTMFVPTDAAFINLGMNLEQLLDDPELANTVRFHIVQGEALDRAMLDARSGQDLTMSNGQSNPLSQNGESLQIGSATITGAPGEGRVNNGVFYLIDRVLIPATAE